MYWFFLVWILLYELLGSTPFLLYFVRWLAGILSGFKPEFAALIFQSLMNLRFLIVIPAVYSILMEVKSGKIKLLFTAMLLIGLFYSILLREQNDTAIFRAMVLIVASYGRDFKKIAKTSLFLTGGVTIFTIAMNLLGVIPEYTLERNGDALVILKEMPFSLERIGVLRHSFGFLGPTNLAGHCCFMILTLIFLRDGILKWYDYVTIGCLTFLNILLVDGRTALITVILAVGGCVINVIRLHFSWKLKGILGKIWQGLLLFSCPIIAGLFLLLSATYNSDPSLWVNRLPFVGTLVGRFAVTKRIMDQLPFSFFGNYYNSFGEESTGLVEYSGNYNFLDSSYARLYLIYGFIGLVLICGMFVLAQYNLRKNEKGFAMFLLAVVFLDCTMEHHLIDPSYNIFLLLPLVGGLGGAAESDLKKRSEADARG